MPKVTATDKARFETYVRDAQQSPQNLEFLLDNLGDRFEIDYSVASLVKSEAAFWRGIRDGLPAELTDVSHFANLLGQYLGECIIHHTSAKWVQCQDPNLMFAQPCIDGFRNQPWDRIYPVDTTQHLQKLPIEKPNFPGVRDQRVLATKLETAIAIYKKANRS